MGMCSLHTGAQPRPLASLPTCRCPWVAPKTHANLSRPLLLLTTMQSDFVGSEGYTRTAKIYCRPTDICVPPYQSRFIFILSPKYLGVAYSKWQLSKYMMQCNKSFFLLFLRPQDGLSVRIKGREVRQGCDAYGKELTLKSLSVVSINRRGYMHILNRLPHKYTQTKSPEMLRSVFQSQKTSRLLICGWRQRRSLHGGSGIIPSMPIG